MKLLIPSRHMKELEEQNVHIGSRVDEVKITPSFYNVKKVADVFLGRLRRGRKNSPFFKKNAIGYY